MQLVELQKRFRRDNEVHCVGPHPFMLRPAGESYIATQLNSTELNSGLKVRRYKRTFKPKAINPHRVVFGVLKNPQLTF